MNDTITLRDHSQVCIHDHDASHEWWEGGVPFEDGVLRFCPGGRERTFRRPALGELGWADDAVWVEVDDDE